MKTYYYLIILLFSCSSTSQQNSTPILEETKTNEYSSKDNQSCRYENGIYNAIVLYNNQQTGYSQTYTLDVKVENCTVLQINFPNGGHLDKDHITPSYVDENGRAYIKGEDGKTYDVRIEQE